MSKFAPPPVSPGMHQGVLDPRQKLPAPRAIGSETCPECGSPMLRQNVRGSLLRHEVGLTHCKAAKWTREIEQKGLVRIDGDLSVQLGGYGFPFVYGPVVDTRYGRKASTTGAFAPRWAAALAQIAGVASIGLGKKIGEALTRCQSDPEYAAAIAAISDLSESHAERRKALLQFINAENEARRELGQLAGELAEPKAESFDDMLDLVAAIRSGRR
jgi:hypothetical protein